VPLRPPQILQELAWDRTCATAATGWQLDYISHGTASKGFGGVDDFYNF